MLVLPLEVPLQLCAEHFEAQGFSVPFEIPVVVGVGVPNPLRHVGNPAFPSCLFDLAHHIVVAEGVEPAEDFPDDPDQGARRGEVRRHAEEQLPPLPQGRDDPGELLPLLLSRNLHGPAQVPYRIVECTVGRSFLCLVRADPEEKLLEEVPADHGPPGGAEKFVGMLSHSAVPVRARGGDEQDVAVPHLLENHLHEGAVLAEPARSIGGRHEERHLSRGDFPVHQKLERVTQRHLLGEAFLSRGESSPQEKRLLVRWRHGPGVDPDRTKRRGNGAHPCLGHRGEEHRPAGKRRPAHVSAHHRNTPLLSRYASQRVMYPASLACPSN